MFVSCAEGLEPLLLQELRDLGFTDCRTGYRGVYVQEHTMEAIYTVNYCSRIASRVLLPLKSFRCHDKESLYDEVRKIEWLDYIPANKTFAIDANVTHSVLRNSLFAAQVVKDGICDHFRSQGRPRPNVDVKHPDVQLNLFINQQKAVLSFDTSGQPLHRRGYREEGGIAPIRETLAAALLRLAGYHREVKLFDPFCGSGTLLIEAALMATQTPPGYKRSKWGFFFLPDYREKAWLEMKNSYDEKRTTLEGVVIEGAEINRELAAACRRNAEIAGFGKSIFVYAGDFRSSSTRLPYAPNFIITNPPYGERMSEVSKLRVLYRGLGDFMKKETAKPAKGFVLTGSVELAKEVGLAAKRRHVVNNNGIDSRLLEFDLY